MKMLLILAAFALAAPAQQKLIPVDEAGFNKVVSAHKGRVVLVDFWATWCKPCRAETPQLVKLEQKLKARGFDFVTVSADEADRQADALKVLKEDGVTGPTYWKKAADDDKFNDAIDPKWGGALPALFLYDRNGKKVKSFIGETPVAQIEAAISKLL
jgi:thiol-disulfide isomerase/thioredoxin